MRWGRGHSDQFSTKTLGSRLARAWTWWSLLAALSLPVPAGAAEPKIVVAPLIMAEISSELDFDIHVESAGPLPGGSSLIISGLPKSITFSAGNATAPGMWQVPVRALNKLKMVVAPGEASRSNLLFLLSNQEKGVVILASARSVLVVDGVSAAARAKQLEDAGKVEEARAEELRRLAAAKAAEEDRLAETRRAQEARTAAEARAEELRRELAEIRRAQEARRVAEARAEELRRELAAAAAEEERLRQAQRIEEEEARAEELRRRAAAKAAEEDRLIQAKRIEEEAARVDELHRQAAAAKTAEVQLAQTERVGATKKAEITPAEDLRPQDASAQPADTSRTIAALPAEQALAATRLVKRGEEQLNQGNVLAARQYFLRAAQAGLADGAFKLGETHDPHELARWNVHGVMPDLAEAKAWYRRALHLGVTEAKARLTRLGE